MTSTAAFSDEYVVIKKPQPKAEEKALVKSSKVTSALPVKMVSSVTLLRDVAPNLRVPQTALWLTTTFTNTSAAATAQFPVFGVIPGSSAEFASLAALYSEYRVTKVEIIYHTHASDTSQTNTCQTVMTYDPTRNTALASIVAGVSSTYHKLTVMTPTAAHVSPKCVNSTGFFKLTAQVPLAPVNSVNEGTDLATGKWSDTLDTSVFYGFIRAGVTSASAGTTTIDGFLRMHTQFRSRQ